MLKVPVEIFPEEARICRAFIPVVPGKVPPVNPKKFVPGAL
jgi:hypothetical protein